MVVPWQYNSPYTHYSEKYTEGIICIEEEAETLFLRS